MSRGDAPERGQILVLLVLAFVVLLGFAALALDGSMVYADRRRAQNAADAASLAGANAAAFSLANSYTDYLDWTCVNNGTSAYWKIVAAENAAEAAAIHRAASNDYTIDADISDFNGVEARCGELNNVTWVDRYMDITTTLTSTVDTSFAHLIYGGPLRNRVTAVGRVRPGAPAALGNAIVALRRVCQGGLGGITFDGNNLVNITGGGAFSNRCIVFNGGVDVTADTGLNCTLGSGDTRCYTDNGASNTITPYPPNQGTEILPRQSFYIPPPDCSSLPNRTYHNQDTISPGNYDRIKVNAGRTLVMESGLYCIQNDFWIVGNASVSVEPGGGVTIYIQTGDFHVGGSNSSKYDPWDPVATTVNLAAPPVPPATCTSPVTGNNYCPPAIPGVLIYLAEGNTNEVSITGSSLSHYVGTVYAPDGVIEAGGGSIQEINAQMIADTVVVHGTPDLAINFLDDTVYHVPARLELAR